MSRLYLPLLLATSLFLAAASPGTAQLWYVPDHALPSFGGDAVEPWVGATYGRGLNDASVHTDVLGIVAGVASPRVVASAGIGHVGEAGGEATLGLALGVDLLSRPRSRLLLQGGVAHVSFEDIPDPFAARRFPLGVAVARTIAFGDSTIEVWVMPRLTLVQTSETVGVASEWDTAVGVWITGSRGIGIHLALDGHFVDDTTPWYLGFGFHWTATGIRDALRTG